MQILFEPKFKIGDTLYLRINPEKKMVVDAYKIYQVNSAGEVISFSYSLYDGEGIQYYYRDIDLELQESLTNGLG